MTRKPKSASTSPSRSRSRQLELIEGDFLVESPKRVKNASIDCVVTSPPYNIGIDYGKYRDDLPRDEYLAWTAQWADEVKRILAPKGSLFLNVGIRPSEPWGAWQVAEVFRQSFHLQNVIHWVKSISIAKEDVGNYPGITQDVTVGHYKPINSKRFLNDAQEYIFHFTHSGNVELDRTAIGVPYQDETNIRRWGAAGSGLHCRGNVWFIPYKTIKNRDKDRPHPASFPPKLPEMCMRLHGLSRIRRAMDPFLGLGSSALAARDLGVPFIGFEIDPAYLDLTRQRLSTVISPKRSARGRARPRTAVTPTVPDPETRQGELF